MKGDDAIALSTMIDFMYGIDYETDVMFLARKLTGKGSASALHFTVSLYEIAEKYGVPELKRRAKGTVEDIIRSGWCWDNDELPAAIKRIYSTTPRGDRGLRDPIVEAAHEHAGKFLDNDSFCSSS